MKENRFKKYYIIRSRNFLNMMLSFLFTIIAVLCIMMAVVYNRFINMQRQTSVSEMKKTAANAESILSSKLLDMKHLSIVASRNPIFGFYPDSESDVESTNEIVKQLQNYASANSFYVCIGFSRSSEPEMIYTSLGEFEKNEFDHFIISINENSTGGKSSFLDISTGQNKMPGNNNEVIYCLSNRIDSGDGTSEKQIKFYVSKSDIDSMFENVLASKGSNLVVFDERNNIIYSYGSVTDGMVDISKGMDSNYKVEKTDGKKYAFFHESSSYNGWRYVLTVSTDKLFYKYNTELAKFYRLIMIILIFAVISSVAAALLAYRPIWKIFGRVLKNTDEDIDVTYRFDDIGYIDHAVEDILNAKEQSIRSSVLLNLLWGQYDDPLLAETDCEEASVQFMKNGFLIGVVNSKTKTSEEIANLLERQFNSMEIVTYWVRPQEKSAGYFIVNYDSGSGIDNRIVSVLREYLSEQTDKCKIGLSNCTGSIMQLSQAFTQAKSACRYLFMKSDDASVALYSDIELKIGSVQLSGLKKSAVSLVSKGNERGLLTKIDGVMETVPDTAPLEMFRFAVYGIIAAYAECATALKLPVEKELDNITKAVMSASSPDRKAITEQVYDIGKKLCSFYDKPDSKDDELLQKINNIISNRMCDQMLTLETFSEECNVSTSYLGRYFKEKIGISPMKYINIQKMEYSKKLLRETDMTLNEIVLKSGYIDVSNFIRKFRQEVGMTPINYRKEHAQNK